MRGETPCAHCEQVLQPYLDRELSEQERVEAAKHLDECPSCKKAYRFEESLRGYVRKSCVEQMSSELRAKLAALRTPL
jgi:anti-sigma factor (TIGR02949 family)